MAMMVGLYAKMFSNGDFSLLMKTYWIEIDFHKLYLFHPFVMYISLKSFIEFKFTIHYY